MSNVNYAGAINCIETNYDHATLTLMVFGIAIVIFVWFLVAIVKMWVDKKYKKWKD